LSLREEFLHTSTDPGFSIRRTVSSVIGSISGFIVPDKSSDPLTCSLWILTSAEKKWGTYKENKNMKSLQFKKIVFDDEQSNKFEMDWSYERK